MGARVAWRSAVSPLAHMVPEDRPKPLPVTSLLDRFAEELSEHGDIAKASMAIRVPEGTGQSLFEAICRRLGRQAQ